jgi:DNA segregation ATPase FtsK/SpoIIIE-like protein
MEHERIRLGLALTRTKGPLVVDIGGQLHAVWPYGPGHAPHVLVIGSTGGGKTTLLRYMLTGLLRTPGQKAVSLADGKGASSFLMFYGLPGVADVANTPGEITAMVRGFHADIETRYARLVQAKETALKTRGRPAYQRPGPSWLVLDEYMNWVLGLDDTTRKEVIGKLVRIGSVGREVEGRLLIATQRPDAKSIDAGLPGLLKAQLKARIAATGVMGMDSIEARMAFDDDKYADRVPDRLGGGLIKVGRHEAPFVVPWMADPTDPGTSDADREAAWRLLPAPVQGAAIG